MSAALPGIRDEGRELVRALAEAGTPARLLGGVAVAEHRHAGWGHALERRYGDIDLAAGSRAGSAVAALLAGRGYGPAQPFNRLHGDRRLLFYDRAHGRQVDVFLGRFAMCHELDLEGRLAGHPTTLSPADLLLTKLQVVEPDAKDLLDAVALFHQHELGEDRGGDVLGEDRGGDVLGVDRLVAVTRALGLVDDAHGQPRGAARHGRRAARRRRRGAGGRSGRAGRRGARARAQGPALEGACARGPPGRVVRAARGARGGAAWLTTSCSSPPTSTALSAAFASSSTPGPSTAPTCCSWAAT